MHHTAILLSIPGLRAQDVASMPRLQSLAQAGGQTPLVPSFPCVTCPVQVSLTTGVPPREHGVLANGFYWRDRGEVEMWTAWNEVIQAPQIWQRLKEHDSALTSAVWFPMLIKGASADYICTPAPIHNPDGSESLWCYTQPPELYGELRDTLGHFPLMNFWGPLANIKSTAWIVASAIVALKKFQPRFLYAYLTHLDYAAQKFGPESPQAATALQEIDVEIGRLIDAAREAVGDDILWIVASEYVITPVTGAVAPNRLLREAGLLSLREDAEGREELIPGESRAWALVDHQLAHVYVKDPSDVEVAAEVFRGQPGIERVLVGDERATLGMDHERAGEIVLVSAPDQWFCYYWWHDDARAPQYARTVDIHRKPGYDPVEMFIEMPQRTIPLDATLVKGSHGYPADSPERQGICLVSDAAVLPASAPGEPTSLRDTDIAGESSAAASR